MNGFHLRYASEQDIDFLFNLANDPECRSYSFNSDMIERSVHENWFDEVLKSTNRKIYIYISNEDQAIGQARLELFDSNANISYSIVKEFRGHGHGKALIKLLEEEALKYTKIVNLHAQVKYDNAASIKIFEQIGYKKVNEKDYFEFIKKIR